MNNDAIMKQLAREYPSWDSEGLNYACFSTTNTMGQEAVEIWQRYQVLRGAA